MENHPPQRTAGAPPADSYRREINSHREAVLAMVSGGCARYAFSADALCCLDRQGIPLLAYESGNPHHHLIMTNSGMSLRYILSFLEDGTEDQILILCGRLDLVDPGDHDALDRYLRYFGGPLDNHLRGVRRLYRLRPDRAHVEVASGQTTPLPLPGLIERNPFSEKEEISLLQYLNREHRADLGRLAVGAAEVTAVGVDEFGLDVKAGKHLLRHEADRPLRTSTCVRDYFRRSPPTALSA